MRGGRAFAETQRAGVIREYQEALAHGQDDLADRIERANPDIHLKGLRVQSALARLQTA